MLRIVPSNKFKKDLKLAVKRGYDIKLLENVVNRLANEEPLEPKYKDHTLSGDYSGFRECHITPDWLLVYQVINDELYCFCQEQELTVSCFNN